MRRLTALSILSMLLLSAGGAWADGWNPAKRQPGGVSVTVSQPGGPGAYSEAGGSQIRTLGRPGPGRRRKA
jgi:hypothetical protein